jgi:hypothetical protein
MLKIVAPILALSLSGCTGVSHFANDLWNPNQEFLAQRAQENVYYKQIHDKYQAKMLEGYANGALDPYERAYNQANEDYYRAKHNLPPKVEY